MIYMCITCSDCGSALVCDEPIPFCPSCDEESLGSETLDLELACELVNTESYWEELEAWCREQDRDDSPAH